MGCKPSKKATKEVPKFLPRRVNSYEKGTVQDCSMQLTLKTDRPIEEIDTELYLTIGQIRDHLYRNYNLQGVRLIYEGRELDNDESTLADYGFISGTRGIIDIVELVTGRLPVRIRNDSDRENF